MFGHRKEILFLAALEIPPDDRLEISACYTPPGAPRHSMTWAFHHCISSSTREFVQWFILAGLQLPSDAILYTTSGFLWTRIDIERFLSILEFLLVDGAPAVTQDAHGCNALHLVSSNIYGFDDTSVGRVVRMLWARRSLPERRG